MKSIRTAAEWIRQAEALIISAGAGMGVDSGLPDYRGREGFWNAYPLYRNLGVDYEKMTRPSGFRLDPSFAWGFYGHCLDLYRRAVPHRGFQVLLEQGRSKPGGYYVFTSNIDGQFQKAGFEFIHECHGSIHRLQCIHPCCRDVWSVDALRVEVDPDTMRAIPPLPRCRNCGALARPNLFAFADTGYIWDIGERQADDFRQWREKNKGRRIVIIECGAGTTVPGIRRHGEDLCRSLPHTRLIRINPREAHTTSPGQISLFLGAAEALARIQEMLP